ncbi:MAG: SusC/RagA family TonB-linked outer membrane protein, partial [Mucilaginibacter sp.]
MKLTLFFILIFNIGAFADVYSQTKISLDFKNTNLSKVLSTIEHESSYHFAYSNGNTPADKKVSIFADNESITDVLDKILDGLNLGYKVMDNNLIVIAPLNKLADYTANEQAAAIKISGLVTDEGTGETLIGATVRVKGTSIATVVDISGKFTVDVPNNNAVLIVSYLGYTTQEIQVGTKTVLDIKLSKVTSNLDEVVVTGFGLTQKKATLSGAITQLSGEDLAHSKATSASGALVGKVAGINFRQTTGQPGATPTIRIRNFGADPLIIIDGVRRDMDAFNSLDYNDIESLNVLKDGSAAIYGFNAENGVIVVTTKKGKRGQKPTISFDTYYGTQTVTNFNKPGDIKSYVKGIVQSETYGDGKVSSATRTITPDIYNHVMNGDPGYTGFDWYKYIYKSAPQYQAKLSVSGGTDNSDYYISATTLQQDVGLRDFGDGFKRQNIQANFNTNISKRLRFGMQMNGYWSKTSTTNVPGDEFTWQSDAAYKNVPILPGPGVPYTNPISGPYANGNSLYPQNTSPTDWTYSYGLVNPLTSGVVSTTRRNIQIAGNLELDILPGLKARVLASYSFLNNQFDSRSLSNPTYSYDAVNGYVADSFSLPARSIDHNWQNTDKTSTQFQLEYKKSIGKHNFSATASEEYTLSYAPRIRVVGAPPANNIGYLPNYTYGNTIEDDPSVYQPSQGYIARVTYDYAGKYIVEGAGRYDGSSDYTPEKRWGFFPTTSVAYRISQEDFWKKTPILSIFNDFKIRASYGILGGASNGNTYLTGYSYSQGSSVLNNTIVTGTQVNPPPSYLTWVRTYSSDVGIDMSVLKSRLSITLDYFNRTRTGIPASSGAILPDVVGFSAGQANLNTDKNRGVDGNFAWRDRIGEVSYGINGNFSYGRSITGFRYNQLFNSDFARFRGLQSTNLSSLSGTAYGVDRLNGGPFQYQVVGQFQNWDQIQHYPIDQDGHGNRDVRPGDFMYKDVNGDGFINYLDQTRETYQVNGGQPILSFGFGFNVNYKGFDFRADFTGGSMFTFEQSGGSYMREWLPNQNTSQYLFDNSSYYSNPFDRNSTIIVGKFPLLIQGNAAPNTVFSSTGWQTNVTYVR